MRDTGGYHGPPILALGFRIFFLLGAVWAIASVGIWLAVYAYGASLPNLFSPFQWHGREMLFGYAGAIIAGFLLTAPGNWTGAPMPSGFKLLPFVILWLAGRFLPFAHSLLPKTAILLVDVAFFLTLAIYLAQLLLRFRMTGNLFLPLLLLAMGAADVLTYTGHRNAAGNAIGTELMLYLVLILIAAMGGRMIPGFTRTRHPQGKTRVWPVLDIVAMALLIATGVVHLLAAPAPWPAILFAAATLAHGVRLYGWFTREILREPLLWILHLAYAWLVIGLGLNAAWHLGYGNPLLVRHALTVGTIGSITLGMLCRVTLAHTGRPFILPRGTVGAFGLITAAAVLRVILPLATPTAYLTGLKLSALCWMGAFVIYVAQYGPMLCRPRADGQPG